MDFKTAHQKFLRHLSAKNSAPATILAYGKDISQLKSFSRSLDKNKIHELTVSDLKKFLKNLEKQNFTPKTISRKINSLKTFYRFLVSQKIIKENPAASLSHPKIKNKPPRVLSKLEYRSLRDTVRSDPRLSAIVELMLQTGMRISEVANLRVTDFAIKSSMLKIRPQGSQPPRTVPLNSSAKKALKNYLSVRPVSENNHLFLTKTGRPFLIRNIRASLNRAIRLADVKNACVNDLRHTFIAHQLSAGTPLALVSKIVGHRHLTTTQKYANSLPKAPATLSSLPSL